MDTLSPTIVHEIRAHISWEEAVSRGMELRSAKDNSQWDLGDLALEVRSHYGKDSLGKFANEILINKKSLQQYRRVSAAFPPNSRSPYLSHRHHMLLAARPDRLEWLKKSEENNLTVTQLERELALSDGKSPNSAQVLPEVEKCDTCGGYKLDTDNTCRCIQWGGK